MIPATCDPWPNASVRADAAVSGPGFPATVKSRCRPATSPVRQGRPAKCGWPASMPESITAHVIPRPLAWYERWAASAFTVGVERSISGLTGKSGQTR